MNKNLLTLITLFIFSCTDSFSQIAFQKTFGTLEREMGSSVRQNNDGGYIVAGTADSAETGFKNVYLVRTDVNGDTLWTRLIDDDGNFEVKFARQTFDGSFIVTGSEYNLSDSAWDVFLLKTDAAGNLLWIKNYGGIGHDNGYYVEQTSDSDFVVIGQTFSFGAGSNDVYLIRTDSDGNLEWSRTYGSGLDEMGFAVRQTLDGGFILGGNPGALLLIKTNSAGDTLWTRNVAFGQGNYVYSVSEAADSGYFAVGYTPGFAHTVYAVKTDSQGIIEWSKSFDVTTDDVGTWGEPTSDGGYIVTGHSSFGDFFVIRLNALGNIVWHRLIVPAMGAQVFSVQQTSDGGYVVGGYAGGSSGNSDFYLIKTDTLGDAACISGFSALFADDLTELSSNTTLTILTDSTVVSVPSVQVGARGDVVTFCTTVDVNADDPTGKNTLSIYPNPAHNSFTIFFNDEWNNKIEKSLKTFDLTGRLVYTASITNRKQETVNCNLKAGVYIVKVGDGEKEGVQKLMIE
jgi:hypothetical protein